MTTPKELVARFRCLVDRICTTMEAKNADYSRGEDAFKNLRRHGPYGILVRLDDKLSRLDSLTNPAYGDSTAWVKDESVEDTAIDVAVYSLLFVLLRRELNGYYAVAAQNNVTPAGPCQSAVGGSVVR